MNINEISIAYLEEKEQRRRASTVDGYRSSINLYILPEFGKIDIAAIEPEAIQAERSIVIRTLPNPTHSVVKCASLQSDGFLYPKILEFGT